MPKKTEVTVANATLPANYAETQQSDIQAFKNRLTVSESNKITVTQQGDFKVPTKDGDSIKSKEVSGVIVDFISRKNYYTGTFDRDTPTPPNCFAMGFTSHDNLLPDEESPDKQHTACKGCIRNKWDKDAKGGWIVPTCKSSYRLALIAPDDNGEGKLMTLDLSSTATKDFEKYVRALSSVQKAPYNVITEFSFDSTKDYPSIRCKTSKDVPQKHIKHIMSIRDEALQLISRKPNLENVKKEEVTNTSPKKLRKNAA